VASCRLKMAPHLAPHSWDKVRKGCCSRNCCGAAVQRVARCDRLWGLPTGGHRVRFANTRYRILYQRSENLVVLLHVLEKDTGAVPLADIELAKQRMADFKRRMDGIRRRPPRAAGKDAPPASRPV
jgi:hypothetical protein